MYRIRCSTPRFTCGWAALSSFWHPLSRGEHRFQHTRYSRPARFGIALGVWFWLASGVWPLQGLALVFGGLWWLAGRYPTHFPRCLTVAAGFVALAGIPNHALFVPLYWFYIVLIPSGWEVLAASAVIPCAAWYFGSPALDHALAITAIGLGLHVAWASQTRALFRLRQRHRARLRALPPPKAIQAGIATKERVLSAAYHDLQQPLSIIGLYARAVRGKLDTATHAAILADLAIIEGAGQEIARMVKGVREMCELGHNEPSLEAVDLGALLGDIVRELHGRATAKNLALRLRPRIGPWVHSDRTLLKRAVSNLVGNAIKYTDQGGVVIGVVTGQRGVRLDIRDSGIGIPFDCQPRIFDAYFQGHTHRHEAGLGLGLAIVRHIVAELPGHGLDFRSLPGRGSRFSLALPACAPPPPWVKARPDAVLEGKYIVVVEAEATLREGLLETLDIAGAIVEGADSVAAARTLFATRDRCPDALIAAWRFGGGNGGWSVVAALSERFEWAGETPTLFLTDEPVVAPPHAGCAWYRKPIDPDTLLERLRQLLTPTPIHPWDRSVPEARTPPRVPPHAPPVEYGSPP